MNQLNVFYLGDRVGALAEARGGIVFEYAPEFLASRHELSPLALPLGPGLRSRDQPPSGRLHGLFADSLPDSWGTRVMNDWFSARGVHEFDVSALMRLAYIGDRGFGALSYAPSTEVLSKESNLAELYHAALSVAAGNPIDLDRLAAVGSSAGGARPKVAIWISTTTGDLTAGPAQSDSAAWLVKFDTSADHMHGKMEYAYSLMCCAAGIAFPDTRLLRTDHDDGPRMHFAIRRFDRIGTERVHYQSLAGMCQVMGGDLDYATFLRVTRNISADYTEVLKAFRRAVFNVLAGNRDDHGKNHGFLYRDRQWRLSPAFDVTFTSRSRLPERGMAIRGERAMADSKNLTALANAEGIEKNDATKIFDEVRAAIEQWPQFASAAGLKEELSAAIKREILTTR